MAETPDRLLSVAEAAAELKVTHRRVQQLIDDGRLRAEFVGNYQVIRRQDLDAVRVRRTGRPPKKPADQVDAKAQPPKARRAKAK